MKLIQFKKCDKHKVYIGKIIYKVCVGTIIGKRIKNISQLKLLEILNRIPIFKSLQPTDRSELASMPNLVVFIEKDVTFINRNEHGSTFFIFLVYLF